MQTQAVHPRHDVEPLQDPDVVGHHRVEGEEEHHHEKKTAKVLKKVKAKAKKIKNTLTGHGHDHYHHHDHDNPPDDHDLDEEDDDDDEEMVEDPEVHGAPMYESAAIRDAFQAQPESLSHPGKQGRSTAMSEDPLGPRPSPDPNASLSPGIHQTRGKDPTRTFIHGQEQYPGVPKVNLERPRGLEEDPTGPEKTSDAYGARNYQSKVADPTNEVTHVMSGEEAGIHPIIHSFGKMGMEDESKHESQVKPGAEQELPTRTDEPFSHHLTGSHDQFSPELAPPRPLTVFPENTRSEPEAFHRTTPGRSYDNAAEKSPKQRGYAEKITYATSAIAEKLTPVYQKVAGAGSIVMSKMHGSTSGSERETGDKEQDKGVSVKDYLAEKLRPGDEDRALSEIIADTLHLQKQESHKDTKPVGNVTESEKVAKTLGTGNEDGDQKPRAGSGFTDNAGKAVADKLKGAVSSWFGKS